MIEMIHNDFNDDGGALKTPPAFRIAILPDKALLLPLFCHE